MSDFLKISGNKERALLLRAQANQLKNFMIGNLRNSGLSSGVRQVQLSDGSIIRIQITKDASYDNYRSVVKIFGSGTQIITEEILLDVVFYSKDGSRVYSGSIDEYETIPEKEVELYVGASGIHSPPRRTSTYNSSSKIVANHSTIFPAPPTGPLLYPLHLNRSPSNIYGVMYSSSKQGEYIYSITPRFGQGIDFLRYKVELVGGVWTQTGIISFGTTLAISNISDSFIYKDLSGLIIVDYSTGKVWRGVIGASSIFYQLRYTFPTNPLVPINSEYIMNTYSDNFTNDFIVVTQKTTALVESPSSASGVIKAYRFSQDATVKTLLPISSTYSHNTLGSTFSVDYSLLAYVSPSKDLYITLGLVGSKTATPPILNTLPDTYSGHSVIVTLYYKGTSFVIHNQVNRVDILGVTPTNTFLRHLVPHINCEDSGRLLGISLVLPYTRRAIYKVPNQDGGLTDVAFNVATTTTYNYIFSYSEETYTHVGTHSKEDKSVNNASYLSPSLMVLSSRPKQTT